ncbi:MAG TPA: hypothetical protein VET90_01180, partial [Candidatus Binatus sp.]|nr:hypothetical protein [Candidatus Binatus sp.]
MHGDRIGSFEERLERHELDAAKCCLLGGHERVAPEDRHPEPARSLRDGHPDLAEADDPERPAAQLHPLERAALPLAPPEGGVRLRNVPCQGQEERDR